MTISHYRIDEWADDESRARGGKLFTVVEVYRDGREVDVFETRDEDAAHKYAEALALQLKARRDLGLSDGPLAFARQGGAA